MPPTPKFAPPAFDEPEWPLSLAQPVSTEAAQTADLIAAQWQFCKDHPYGVHPDPYAGGLPMSFPSYCMQY